MKLLIAIPAGKLFDTFVVDKTVSLLKENFEVYFNTLGRNYYDEELYEACRDMDAIVTGWGVPSLSHAGLTTKDTKLKLLIHTGGSVGDLVDNTAYENGITVLSGNKIYAESTAEGAFAYILTALRSLPDDICNMRGDSDYWDSPYLTKGLFERTVGIIGVGAVAKNLMKFMKPFRVKFKVYDTYEVDKDFLNDVNGEQVSLDEVLSESSIVSVHAALGESTRNLIGAREFSLMADGTLFVNTSRGPIIDENAMIDALRDGRLSAILDVYCREPLERTSPLRNMKNVYLMPHKAGPTYDLRGAIGYKLACDAVRFLNGESLQFEIKADAAKRMTKHS